MQRKLLTETELRAHWSRHRTDTFCVEDGTVITPAAQDFLRENGISLRFTPFGDTLGYKPEEMTHLSGTELVSKTHPRIKFRGMVDSLIARLLELQVLAAENGETQIVEELDELLSYSRKIMAAEVKETSLEEPYLLGMNSEKLRHDSQQVKSVFGIDHPVFDHRMGQMCMALNQLRTQVRETELSAAQAFASDSGCTRKDLIEALNRMSSCIYIMICRKLSGYYTGGKRP